VSIECHFTQKDWERIKRDWTAWWQQEIDRPMVVINAYEWQGKWIVQQHEGWDETRGIFPIDSILDYYQQSLENERFYGDSWPRWWPNFGPGIVAGFLGAKVGSDERTVWFEPSTNSDLAHLHPQFDQHNFWWRWVKELTQAAVQRWGEQVTVAHTDLGGNLDILASLRTTQNLLIYLYDAPAEIDRLVAEITRLWLRYYNELYEIIQHTGNGITAWTPLWCPERYYMLQCDFCYMISPAMFERFVLPDLADCCEYLDYAFYHLDGKGQIPHLDMLLSIDRLRGIQWIPGDGQTPVEEWLPLLKRIRDGGKLCQVYATPKTVHTIIRELGGAGFAFWITDAMLEEDVKGFLQDIDIETSISK
jgi:hypothetical protein